MGGEGQVIFMQGSSSQQQSFEEDGIAVSWTLEWTFQNENLIIAVRATTNPLRPQITVQETSVDKVSLRYAPNNPGGGTQEAITIEGSQDSEHEELWLIQLPGGFSMAGTLEVLINGKINISENDEESEISFELENQLVTSRLPALTFQTGLEAFIVLYDEAKKEYRMSPVSRLDRIANVRNAEERLYRWEDCAPMTEQHYSNLAVLTGISGLLEGMVHSDENIGKQFLDQQFQDMKSKNEDSRVIMLNAAAMTATANLRGGVEFFLPDPGENFRSAQRERDRLFSPSTSTGEKVVAGVAMFGFAVFVVVDLIPVAGKADNAVAALKQGDEMVGNLVGRMEREMAQARRLANSDRFSQEARETLSRSADEMQQQIETLRKLRDDLNGISNLSPEDAARLQDAVTNTQAARRYHDQVGRQVMRDFNEGAANAVETMQRRADMQRTLQNIMNSMPTEAARSKWREVLANLSSTANELDENVVIDFLRSQGKLTEEGIERFGRNVANLYSEVGKVDLRDRFRLGPLNETRDLGFEGKRFEEIMTDSAPYEIGRDLNEIRHNFEVVDYVTRVGGRFSEGKIYSIARGGPSYLMEKIRRLFNLLPDDVNRRKFRTMLTHLSRNDVLTGAGPNPSPEELARLQDEFLERAYLLVPSDVEGPLKVLIMSSDDIPPDLRERMANAVTSEVRR